MNIDRTQLLDKLSRLLPAQFEQILFLLAIPEASLSSAYAPQQVRAIEAIRFMEQQGEPGMERMASVLRQVLPVPSAVPRAAASNTTLAASRNEVRQMLRQLLVSDSDLEAFCLDHFPEVHQRFGNRMDRVDKENILLQHIESAEILRYLNKRFPDQH